MPKYWRLKVVFHNNYLFLADFSNLKVKLGIKELINGKSLFSIQTVYGVA